MSIPETWEGKLNLADTLPDAELDPIALERLTGFFHGDCQCFPCAAAKVWEIRNTTRQRMLDDGHKRLLRDMRRHHQWRLTKIVLGAMLILAALVGAWYWLFEWRAG